MRIRGLDVDVDFRTEIEEFEDRFNVVRDRGNKFIATSPFREEKHPSFAVNLETGTYIDSGCTDDDWRVGNFIKLLSFLREETYEDTEDFLLQKYQLLLEDADALELVVNFQEQVNQKIFPIQSLKPYSFKSNYLSGRNITEQVQLAFKAGYDPNSKALVLPVFDKKGNIVNFKFRKIDSKIFWYDKSGQPIKQHLYGLNFIHRMNCKRAYIVEGEIDCMYLWSMGIPAIATFGASLSEKQEKLILSSPIETLILAGDNDNVGKAFTNNMEKRLSGRLDLETLELQEMYKDVNEIPPKSKEDLLKTITSNPSFI